MQTKTKGAPLRRALKSRMSTSTIHTSYHVHVCLKRIAYTFCKSPYNIFSWLGQLPYWPEPLWSTAGRTGLKFQHQPVLPFHTSTPSQKNAGKMHFQLMDLSAICRSKPQTSVMMTKSPAASHTKWWCRVKSHTSRDYAAIAPHHQSVKEKRRKKIIFDKEPCRAGVNRAWRCQPAERCPATPINDISPQLHNSISAQVWLHWLAVCY